VTGITSENHINWKKISFTSFSANKRNYMSENILI
jgi:hypothetical protein